MQRLLLAFLLVSISHAADKTTPAKMLSDLQTGSVTLEVEGKENPDTAVPKSLAILREAFQ